MSHRLQLLLCSFCKLRQIQTALNKENINNYFPANKEKETKAKVTDILTYFLSIQCSTGEIRL